jgi:hypothetical protein
MKSKKRIKKIVMLSIILPIFLIGIILAINYTKTGKTINSNSGNSQQEKTVSPVQEQKIVSLSLEEKQKVTQVLLNSEFIKDIPENSPIALTFFSFEGNERILHDTFLIGKNTLSPSGSPIIYLSLPTKYIPELSGNNLCDIIQQANKNHDLGFYTEVSTTALLLKYSGMLKYKSCFGF